MSGHVYKRCGCPVQRDAKGKKLPCPRTHGSWTFVANATMEGPLPRRQYTKGGFATKREAEAALRAFQASVDRGEVQRQNKITGQGLRIALVGCRGAEPGRDRRRQLPDPDAVLRPAASG